jgi:hypothetical protein
VPVLVDRDNMVLAGHGRLLALPLLEPGRTLEWVADLGGFELQ